MTIDDLAPDAIIEAAARRGLTLTRGAYHNPHSRTACPLGVLVIDGKPEINGDRLAVTTAAQHTGLSAEAMYGLVQGFEGWCAEHKPGSNLDHDRAWRVGREVARRAGLC